MLVFVASLVVECLGFYVICCNNFFMVPRLFKEYQITALKIVGKREIYAGGLSLKERALQYRMKVKPLVKISDGGFRYMESSAVLSYLEFYLCSAISLLLTF